MGTLELREKLIEKFNLFIQDDSKLLALNGIFDSIMHTSTPSIVPDEHYKTVEERRRQFHEGKTKGATWDDVKQNLKGKYGF